MNDKMGKYISVLLPIFPKTRDVYFLGYVTETDSSIQIFITNFSTENIYVAKSDSDVDIVYGRYSRKFNRNNITLNTSNYLLIEGSESLEIINICIHGSPICKTNQAILLLYDYHRVNSSETIDESNDFISKLKYYLEKEVQLRECCEHVEPQDYFNLNDSWLSLSMFIKHFVSYINLLYCLLSAKNRRKKISIEVGNLIMALTVDVLLGYLLLDILMFDQRDITTILLEALEELVNFLYSLLSWVMGAPAGLKLNNAFNKMLGKYFLYHVELWRLFLDVTREKLDFILYIYQYLGYLGLTFQAAIISDMICLATFHLYCLYIYAARLFNIQISGLIALSRLFVGRKYNPLRGGVDSCEYTNQELFVGTVAFTILLLLLPTTVMYYIVFTMFRVLSLFVQYTLAKLIYIIQCTPLYVFILWMTQSSKIAGNVYIEEVTHNNTTLTLHVRLLNKSIGDLIVKFKPPIDMLKKIEWTYVAKNVFTGKNII